MIPDEPVRGLTPQPWVGSMSGIDRCRAYSRGLLPATPMARLFGYRLTHVAAGTVTLAMPANDASIAGIGQMEISAPMIAALEGACNTALPSGYDVLPLRLGFDPFRPAWPGRGNLLCRARVVSSSNLFVNAVVQVEDSEGRHVAQGSLHGAVVPINPPSPPPPEKMPPVEEPVYDTPDPYLRKVAVSPVLELMEREDGVEIMRQFKDGRIRMPIASLYGISLHDIEENRASLSMPASGWFCAFGRQVSAQAIGALANIAIFSGVVSRHRPGSTTVMLGSATTFLRQVPADGRELHAEVSTCEAATNLYLAEATLRNAEGEIAARSVASIMRIDASKRERRQRAEARRVLATLLFVDIVDSTALAGQMGDAAWRNLLEEFRQRVRREISRFNGTEVDTAGDGFFVRFESPAYAIEAARAAGRAIEGLGVQLRAGVHTGECELVGTRLAGMAVHVAARIMGLAGAGETVVSSTVRELSGGSGFSFADRGEHELKGVPEKWRVYSVSD
ncbi:MAG: adenylate/guanylate cyclase domain-containing protein [Gammaproteobacteria bacterium]